MTTILDNLTVEGLLSTGRTQTGFTATTLSASTLSLTSTSTRIQYLSGTTFGQVVALPDATTLTLGWEFRIINDSGTFVELQDGSAAFLEFMFPYSSMLIVVSDVGSAAGMWEQSPTPFHAFNNPRVRVNHFDDFLGGTVTGTQGLGWTTATNGAGAGFSFPTIAATNNAGVLSLNSGTNAAGRACIFLSNTALTFSGGVWVYDAYVRTPTLSDGTQTYKIYAGFGDVTGAGNMVDGVYFSYSSGELAGNWAINTANNSARTQGDSNIPATTSFTRLRFVVNAAGTSVTFFIGNANAGTITTNIPTTTARVCGPIFKIEKSNGTTSRSLEVDYYSSTFFATTARG